MSPAVRSAILNVIGRQQVALDCAIERGNIGYQVAVARRMAKLEAILDDGRQTGEEAPSVGSEAGD